MCLAHSAATPPGQPPVPDHGEPAPQPAAVSPRGSSRTSRRKLWDIDHKYHCPIIGTCLDVDELRRIAARAGGRAERRLADYEVHVSFVAAADERNNLSLACHKALDKKHGAEVRRFAGAAELPRLWAEARAEGRVPGALWALMSDPRADEDLQRLAYEDVHMLSHQVGAGLVSDARRLAGAQAEIARLRREGEDEARRSERRLGERDRRIAELTDQLTRLRGLEAALAAAHVRVAQLESETGIAELRERLARAESRLAELEHRAAQASLRAERWRARCETARQELRRVQPVIADGPADSPARADPATVTERPEPACDGDCAACPDLAGRRVLCIGGRDTLAGHYRDLVDRCNGRFVRHDGGIEDNIQRLTAMLASADAVVCPADCVSHDAYHRAKRFCRRTGKPCILLKSSGVTAFAQALRAVAA